MSRPTNFDPATYDPDPEGGDILKPFGLQDPGPGVPEPEESEEGGAADGETPTRERPNTTR